MSLALFTVTYHYVFPFTLWLLNCMIVKSFTEYLQVQFTSYLWTPTMQCLMEESVTNGLGTEKHLKKAVTQKTGEPQRRYGTGRSCCSFYTAKHFSFPKTYCTMKTQPQRIPAFLWSETNCIVLHEHSVQYLLSSMLLLKINPTRSTPVNKICMSQIRASNFSLWITCVFSMTPCWQNLQFLCFFSKRKCVQLVYFHWPELPLIQGESNVKQRSCITH